MGVKSSKKSLESRNTHMLLISTLSHSLSTSLFPLLLSVEEFFLSGWPSSSAEERVVVIHDIKEVEGERQQEVQEDKRDEEIGDEVNGEVEEEITQRAHETWLWRWSEQGTNLSHIVRARNQSKDNDVNWQQKRDYENEGSSMDDDSCIGINYIYAHTHVFPKCFKSLHKLLGFALCFMSSILILVAVTIYSILTCTRIPCRVHTAKMGFLRCCLYTPSRRLQ